MKVELKGFIFAEFTDYNNPEVSAFLMNVIAHEFSFDLLLISR